MNKQFGEKKIPAPFQFAKQLTVQIRMLPSRIFRPDNSAEPDDPISTTNLAGGSSEGLRLGTEVFLVIHYKSEDTSDTLGLRTQLTNFPMQMEELLMTRLTK